MYLILTASPNQNGLTAACGSAAEKGILDGGGTVERYDLCTEKIQGCLVCADGWGICKTENRCVIEDSLQRLKDKMAEAEGIFLITPVYWAQQSERMKYFCDRVRRCEVSCLTDMELWCRHVGAVVMQRIGIDRFNRGPMLKVIEHAGRDLTGKPA